MKHFSGKKKGKLDSMHFGMMVSSGLLDLVYYLYKTIKT